MAKQFSDLNQASKQIVIGLFCRRCGYHDTVQNPDDPSNPLPNPETKAQFVSRKAQEWIVQTALAQRAEEQAAAAAVTGSSDADL